MNWNVRLATASPSAGGHGESPHTGGQAVRRFDVATKDN